MPVENKQKNKRELLIINLTQRFFLFLESLLYKTRDVFWDYPDLFAKESKYRNYIEKLYKSFIPYSHIAAACSVAVILLIVLFVTGFPKITGSSSKTLIEGVVMGVDGNGDLQSINKINPLIPSNIQFEKDLVNLIYEPLIRYHYIKEENADTFVGGVEYILADSIVTIRPGSFYQFNLRKDVYWHDKGRFRSEKFDADDVLKTFELLSSIDDQLETQNAYTRALKQLQWRKIDDYTLVICTIPLDETRPPCIESDQRPIFSNFLELISFKIIPEHLSDDINTNNINTNEPELFRSPVGTGEFRLSSVSETTLLLTRNNKYYRMMNRDAQIEEIRFQLYRTINDAVSALRNGEVHSFASVSVEYVDSLREYPQIQQIKSPVLYTQFWGLYFNLRTRPDGAALGPESLTDINVRRAISAAINRNLIVSRALRGLGEESLGPIPKISYYFNKSTDWYTFNKVNVENLLDKAGWELRGRDQVRTNNKGEKLSLSLYFVDSFDRRAVAESIKADLAAVGIEVITNRKEQPGQNEATTEGWSLKEINEQILAPGLFDMILYGMNTFIDPDRYELYHSSQVVYPGLNISGYISSEQTVDVREDRKEGESSLVSVPKVDKFLEQARSFDPVKEKEARQDRYFEIQELIAKDAPLAYLYHPQFVYFVNNRMEGVSLEGVNSLEERFINIDNWKIVK